MKKIILTIITISIISFANAQESRGYIGISIGPSFSGSDWTESIGKAGTGVNLGLVNAGFRFSERLGITLNWGSHGFVIDEDAKQIFGIGYLAIGPMVSFNISDKIGVDLKPQIALTSGIAQFDNVQLAYNSSLGLLVGSSLNYSLADHWELALNLDFMSTKFNKLEGMSLDSDFKPSTFNSALGIHYKF